MKVERDVSTIGCGQVENDEGDRDGGHSYVGSPDLGCKEAELLDG